MSKNLYCMKSLIQNIKFIFKKNIFKKIFWVLVLLWVWIAVFSSSQNTVYAINTDNTVWGVQTNEQKHIEKISDIIEIFDFVLKLIYALLWPVLFIAGLALDNSLVYGSLIHLDASLWSLWNIMKNFANFALWFLVLFAIVRNIFSVFWKEDKNRSPVNIIKKTLIAWVLIQMSWFLMAAIIDVSTIMTYSIWWLPMTVLQNDPKYEDMPILWISADLSRDNVDKDWMNFDFYSTYGDKNISQCSIKDIPSLTGKYIVWREKVSINSGEYFEEWICSWWARPYKYKEYMTWYDNKNNDYKNKLDYYLSEITSWEALQNINNCNFISTDDFKIPENCTWYWFISKDDDFFTSTESQLTLNGLLEKSKWFVWPFITIYSSILDFSSLTKDPSGDKWIFSNFFELLIKFLFAVALFSPLVVLAIVLISRIGMLWLAVVISPILVLLNVFSEALGDYFKWMLESFSFPNLIRLIFAPVFVVFAISMSLIFLTALKPGVDSNNTKELKDKEIAQLESVWVTKTENKYEILSLIWIDFGDEWLSTINDWKNTFSWLIVNLFSVWIIWFFLFFAVKMTKIGKSIWNGIQGSMQKLMSNLPLLPIPGVWWVWIAAAWNVLKDIQTKLGSVDGWQTERLQKAMPWLYGDAPVEKDKAESWLSTLDSSLRGAILRWFEWWRTWSEVRADLNESDKGLLAQQNINSAADLHEHYNTYVSNNISKFDNYENLIWDTTNEAGITTYDAENLSNSNIENMANSGGNWWTWAKWVLGGNVKTISGTYVMVNQGTHENPEFKLVDQDKYATDYLWQTPEWQYDEKASNDNIKSKIEKQYIKEYGELEFITNDIRDQMNMQIAAQQEEINDRISLLNNKGKESVNKTKSKESDQANTDESKSNETES